ncbi:hypothetical protein [Nocardia otitidiscaviarum]|uniref:hypothetical protein n=1 Tax=Nocardia otitidiscaviarum TaxID=1823 RepID=UPI0024550EFE|nr:hypothetical protein [Nocardia otitidiscaviarum]
MDDLRQNDPEAAAHVEAAVDVLSEHGPTLGRPLVDTLVGELRRSANDEQLQ